MERLSISRKDRSCSSIQEKKKFLPPIRDSWSPRSDHYSPQMAVWDKLFETALASYLSSPGTCLIQASSQSNHCTSTSFTHLTCLYPSSLLLRKRIPDLAVETAIGLCQPITDGFLRLSLRWDTNSPSRAATIFLSYTVILLLVTKSNWHARYMTCRLGMFEHYSILMSLEKYVVVTA